MKPVDEAKVPTRGEGARGVRRARWTTGTWKRPTRPCRAGAAPRRRARCSSCSRKYGCRDFRDIGHKAIYVANAFRTLEVIGWQHAEPVLRSLAFALLKHDGKNPAKDDLDPDRPGREERRAASRSRPIRRGGTSRHRRRRSELSRSRSAPRPPTRWATEVATLHRHRR